MFYATIIALVAQGIEQRTSNPLVARSNRAKRAIKIQITQGLAALGYFYLCQLGIVLGIIIFAMTQMIAKKEIICV